MTKKTSTERDKYWAVLDSSEYQIGGDRGSEEEVKEWLKQVEVSHRGTGRSGFRAVKITNVNKTTIEDVE